MVNIDTVYQRVLALANKEQRGYITPQEFNLYANQAQMEIFEQYFYDLNQASRTIGNDTVHADIDDMLEEKLSIFERTESIYTAFPNQLGGGFVIPDNIYRISKVFNSTRDYEILSTKDWNDCINGGPLIAPSANRPIANISNSNLKTNPTGGSRNVVFFVKPAKVNWTYLLINLKAMYDANSSTVHFELHPSEETELVYKILKFAGVSMKQKDIAGAAQGMETLQIQQEKQ